jgi:hypothetical protein
MAGLTLKKIGDDVRARLRKAQASGYLPFREPGTDTYGRVSYDVRISNSKSGPKVNVTINGYEWLIPDLKADGAFRRWAADDGAQLIAKVDEVAARERFSSEDGSVKLGGETKLGTCIVSVRMTGVTHVSHDGTETRYVLCDRCRAEIPAHGGVRHSLAGPDGIEELCESCHHAAVYG